MTLYQPRHLAGVFTIDFRVQAHVVVVEVCFFGSLVGPTEGWRVEIIHPSPMEGKNVDFLRFFLGKDQDPWKDEVW